MLVEVCGRDDNEGRFLELSPSKIVGVGVNYLAHAKEMGKSPPREPLLFLKPPSSLLGNGEAIVRPSYRRVDYEAELAVVIGRRAKRVAPSAALSYVMGFTCLNDVTVRDLQREEGQWTRAKGFDTFCPFGPRIVTDLDPCNLLVKSRVNGMQRQCSSTADMIFSVAELVAFVSHVMTLEVGDVITTGTPQGVGNIAVGDVVEIEIEGIGILQNPVVGSNRKEDI